MTVREIIEKVEEAIATMEGRLKCDVPFNRTIERAVSDLHYVVEQATKEMDRLKQVAEDEYSAEQARQAGKKLIASLYAPRDTACEELATEIGKLTDEKQAAYGDSYGRSGEVMKILYPDGIKPEQYTDALAVVRVIDKLFRIATDKDAFVESPWKDIVGYGLLGARRKQ